MCADAVTVSWLQVAWGSLVHGCSEQLTRARWMELRAKVKGMSMGLQQVSVSVVGCGDDGRA